MDHKQFFEQGEGTIFKVHCSEQELEQVEGRTWHILVLAKRDEGGYIGYLKRDVHGGISGSDIDVVVEKVENALPLVRRDAGCLS